MANRITVGPPEMVQTNLKFGVGHTTHASYPIAVPPKCGLPGLAGAETTTVVTRRYREFEWLNKRLHEEVPGAMIPVMPSKQALNNLNQQLLAARQTHLERALNEMVAHAELVDSPALALFLTVPDFNDVKAQLGISADEVERTASGDGGEETNSHSGAAERTPSTEKKGYFGWVKKIPGAGTAASMLPGGAPKEKEVLSASDEKSAEMAAKVDSLDDKVAKAIIALDSVTTTREAMHDEMTQWLATMASPTSGRETRTDTDRRGGVPASAEEAFAAANGGADGEERGGGDGAAANDGGGGGTDGGRGGLVEVAGLSASMSVFADGDLLTKSRQSTMESDLLLQRLLNDRHFVVRAAKEALDTRERERKRARDKRLAVQAKQHAMNMCKDAHDKAKDEGTRAKKSAELEVLDKQHADAVTAADTASSNLETTDARIEGEWLRANAKIVQNAKVTMLELAIGNERAHQIQLNALLQCEKELQAMEA